jgi:hypothetical protein
LSRVHTNQRCEDKWDRCFQPEIEALQLIAKCHRVRQPAATRVLKNVIPVEAEREEFFKSGRDLAAELLVHGLPAGQNELPAGVASDQFTQLSQKRGSKFVADLIKSVENESPVEPVCAGRLQEEFRHRTRMAQHLLQIAVELREPQKERYTSLLKKSEYTRLRENSFAEARLADNRDAAVLKDSS